MGARALGDPRLFGLLQELNVRLISYHQVDAVVAELRAGEGAGLSSRRERLLE